MAGATPKRTRLGREDWIMAALHALTEGGVGAVAVEPLARRLGVTKGSFYWHFKDASALITAAMALWERAATDEVVARLDAIEDPFARLRGLFVEAWSNAEHARLESGIAAAALIGDPRIRPSYDRVLARRRAYTERLYRDLGMSEADARQWGETAISCFLGHVQLAATRPDLSDDEVRARAQHLAEVLVPGA